MQQHKPDTPSFPFNAAPFRAIFDRFSPVWHTLTSPKPSMADEVETARYRMLAATHLVIVFAFVVLVSRAIASNPVEEWLYDADTSAAFVGAAIVVGLYLWLRQSMRVGLIAALTISVVLLAATVPAFFPGSRDTTLYYTVVVPLLTAMFFPGRAALLMWAAVLPALLNLLPVALSFFGVETLIGGRPIAGGVELLVYMTLLIAVFVNHLQTLSNIRQRRLEAANPALSQNEAPLEERVSQRTHELETARQHTEALYRMSTAMNHADSYTRIVQIVADEVQDDTFTLALMVYDLPPSSPPMGRLVASRMPGAATITAHDMALPIGVMPNAGDPMLIVPNMEQPPCVEARACYLESGVMAVASAPVVVGDRVIGSLTYSSTQPVAFSMHDLDMLRIGSQLAAAVIERRQRLDQQVAIADQLRTADAMKNQFLACMSHELRTPLNAILNFTQLVAVGRMGEVNPRQLDALNKAMDSGRHLLSLINDVLDITKIEAGMMQLFVERDIDLCAELRTVKAAALSLIHDKPLHYIEDIDPDLPLLVGDRRRIRQILFNLVANAIQFTESGTVTVSVKRRGDELLFGVIDTGPGIAPEDTRLIFEPFVQASAGLRHAGGTGLGLPISNQLVQAHGGMLWLESTPGHGAAFFFTLPIAAPALIEKMPV